MKFELIFIFCVLVFPGTLAHAQNSSNSSIAIEQLQNEMEKMIGDIEILQQNSNNLSEETNLQLTVMADEISNLQESLEKNQENQKEVENSINNLKEKIENIKIENIEISGKDREPVFVKILKEFYPETALDVVLLFSSFASIVLVAIVWRQTALTKKESEIKRRPWIKIDNTILSESGFVKFLNGKVITWKEYWKNKTTMDPKEIKTIIVHSGIFNGGLTPTPSTIVQKYFSETKITQEILKAKGEFLKDAPLMPQESQTWQYDITPEQYKMSTENPIYLAAECIYQIDSRTKARIGKIWQLSATTWVLDEYWFEEIKLGKR